MDEKETDPKEPQITLRAAVVLADQKIPCMSEA